MATSLDAGLVVPGAETIARDLDAVGPAIVARASEITSRYTGILSADVRARIRKGPTGRVEGSVRQSFVASGGEAIGSVWSADPAIHRLEFGFIGVDVDGRHYHQPAFPAFRPAADAIEPVFVLAVEAGIAEVW